jgi:hypothetical protein
MGERIETAANSDGSARAHRRAAVAIVAACAMAAVLALFGVAPRARASRGAAWQPGAAAAARNPLVSPLLRARGSRAQWRVARTRSRLARAGGAQATRAAVPASAATGAISGSVTSSNNGLPIAGISVCAASIRQFQPPGEGQEECTQTDTAGGYTLAGLETDQYIVEFSVPSDSGLNFVRQLYNDALELRSAQHVSVSAGATTANINASMHKGGAIAGTVTNTKGEPLPEIEVCAFGETFECTVTNAKGEYVVPRLEAGEYEIEYVVAEESEQNYAPEFLFQVSVTVGKTTKEVNVQMSVGGQIEGTVREQGSNVPLPEVVVCANAAALLFPLCRETNANGEYDIAALPTGEYQVEFFSPEFAQRFYNERTSEEEASLVPVVAGSATTGIDAHLSAVPVAEVPPTISGTARVGSTLSVVHGKWSGSPTSFIDEWGRCGSILISSCKTIAEGPSYTPVGADTFQLLRVRETAANGGGTSEASISLPTAMVLPAEAVPTPPAPPGPPPAAGAGVLPTVTTLPSAAQIAAMLSSLLVPHGANAHIAALLRRGQYVLTSGQLPAGQLTISWFAAPTAAHASASKPVLIAVGRLAFSQPATRLAIKLTLAGRHMLRRASRLKVTIKATLRPTGQPAVEVARSATLRR